MRVEELFEEPIMNVEIINEVGNFLRVNINRYKIEKQIEQIYDKEIIIKYINSFGKEKNQDSFKVTTI